MRFLSDADVSRLVSFADAARAIESAFQALADGEATLQPRVRAAAAGSKLSMLGALLPSEGLAGAKVYTTAPDGGFCFSVLLFRQEEQRWVAAMEGGALTRIRTAATSLVAARAMARPASTVLTVFGAGVQARAHCLALAAGFPLRRIRIVHRRPAGDLVRRLVGATELKVEQVDDPREALAGADLVVTATRSAEPLFPGRWLEPGAHVTSVGATTPDTRELDDEAIDRCRRVVVESVEQARREAGNLVGASRNGVFGWEQAVALADVLAGREKGREGLEDVTLFDSLGVGLEDVAVAALAYRRAVEAGAGSEL